MRRSKSVTAEVSNLLLKGTVDIALVQEPYNVEGQLRGIGSQNTAISACAPCESAQAAIVLRRESFTIMKLSHLCDTHVICVQVICHLGELYLVSQYFQHAEDIEVSLERLQKILNALRGKKVIIAADVNASSPLWDAKPGLQRRTRKRERGRQLEALIAQHNLVVLNNRDDAPTYASSRGATNIDVTLATTSAARYNISWQVRGKWSTSDHQAIEIKIDRNQETSATPRPGRFLTSRAKWDRFDKTLREALQNGLNTAPGDPGIEDDQAAENMEAAILKACEASMPRKKWYKRVLPGWTKELSLLKKESYRKRQKFQAEKDPDQKTAKRREYLRAAKTYKKAVLKCRREGWRKFVTEQGNLNPWGTPYRAVTDTLRTEQVLSTLRNNEGEFTDSWTESAKVLINALSPDDIPETDTELQSRIREEVKRIPDTNDTAPFTVAELAKTVKRFGNRKSPGVDGIEVPALKRTMCIAPTELLNAMNSCLETGVFPRKWKTGSIRALLKGKDRDQKESGSRDIEGKAVRVAERISTWCDEKKLKLAIRKTEAILVKGTLARLPQVKLEETTVKCKGTMRYLGVIFGKNFGTAEHVRKVCAKACNLEGKIR
ncbi:hypothetical protein KM043_014481, partial [Ampulex compressa]